MIFKGPVLAMYLVNFEVFVTSIRTKSIIFSKKEKEKKPKFWSLPYRILQISFENFKGIKCL